MISAMQTRYQLQHKHNALSVKFLFSSVIPLFSCSHQTVGGQPFFYIELSNISVLFFAIYITALMMANTQIIVTKAISNGLRYYRDFALFRDIISWTKLTESRFKLAIARCYSITVTAYISKLFCWWCTRMIPSKPDSAACRREIWPHVCS